MAENKEERLKLRLEVVQLIVTLIACLFAAGSWLKSCHAEALTKAALSPVLEVDYVEVSPGSFSMDNFTQSDVFGGRLVVPPPFDYLRDPTKRSMSSIFFDATDAFFKAHPDLKVTEELEADEKQKSGEASEKQESEEDPGPPELPHYAERLRVVFLRIKNSGGSTAHNVRLVLNHYKPGLAGVRLATNELKPRDAKALAASGEIVLELDNIKAGSAILIPLCNLAQFIMGEEDGDFAIGDLFHPQALRHADGKDEVTTPIRKRREFPYLIEQGYEIRG